MPLDEEAAAGARWTAPVPGRGLLAMGDPIYGPGDPRLADLPEESGQSPVDTREPSPPRLAASGEEVACLARIMGAGEGDIRVGRGARGAAVKRLSAAGTLAEYRVIHLACHGVLGRVGDGPPALLLSLAGDLGGEDGHLTPDEVAGLRLDSDLAVLSACQVGRGRLSSAEVLTGLARAFMQAGSRAVAGSPWRVDDAAPSEPMADLYRGLKGGQPAADALRSAQLKMIESGEPPPRWAPFVPIAR